MSEIQGSGGEEDEFKKQRGRQEALPLRVYLSLLRWETLDVFLDSNRQLLSRERSVEVLFRAEDPRLFVE